MTTVLISKALHYEVPKSSTALLLELLTTTIDVPRAIKMGIPILAPLAIAAVITELLSEMESACWTSSTATRTCSC